jgi:hypothetical protein
LPPRRKRVSKGALAGRPLLDGNDGAALGLLAHSIPASAEKSHRLDTAAPLASILDDVVTVTVRGTFLNLHRRFANKAGQEIYQRAFIVVQK